MTGSVKLNHYPGKMGLSCKRCGRGQHVLVLKTFDDHEKHCKFRRLLQGNYRGRMQMSFALPKH
jgi:rRNA maturation protein Nop10